MGSALDRHMHPEVVPLPTDQPSFDPTYGFPEGRPKRVMVATEEQMKSAKIPIHNRDYCAHVLIDYLACRKRVFPLLYKCHDDKHAYLHCEYEDYVLRMKEYERERRLREREQRLLGVA